MARFSLAGVGLCLALAACSSAPADVVSETTANLEELKSGRLELSVKATSPSGAEGEQAEAGFELSGSFELPEEGELPIADLTYSDLGTEGSTAQGFISTGDAAYVVVGDTAYEVPAEQAAALRGGSADGQGLFDELQVSDWIREPELVEGEEHSGEEVDRVSGELDVVAALNDLVSTAQRFGRSDLDAIDADEAERLENAVDRARIELLTGAEDRLLRRLSIAIEFALDESLELTEILGPLAGATFELDLEISDPNEPVEVEAPADPLPLEELQSGT